VTDVDECMFPFIGQAEAGFYALKKVVGGVGSLEDVAFAARMLGRAGGLVYEKIKQKTTGFIQNSLLIMQFEKMVLDVPMSLFEESARQLALRYHPGVVEALGLFTKRGVPAGFVSLGLDFFIEAFIDHLKTEHGVEIAFADCTETLSNDGLFSGYDPEKTLLVPQDKARFLHARAAEYNAVRPVAVGHDRDDIHLFRAARELGGVTVGYNPIEATYEYLDAAIFAPDWKPMAGLFKAVFER